MDEHSEGASKVGAAFLTEQQRGLRAAVLGAAFGVLLALMGRRR